VIRSRPFLLDGIEYVIHHAGDGMSGHHRWELRVVQHVVSCSCSGCAPRGPGRPPVTQSYYQAHVFLRRDESSLSRAGDRLLGRGHGIDLLAVET
jgi:hypothetical protein